MANKIKYGIQNCYYSKITYGSNNAITYGAPVAMPGAVNISLAPEGENNPFYADNIVFFQSQSNNGYAGTLELARIPESFYTDIMGDTTDKAGAVIEHADVQPAEFALLFQFEGDESATRHLLYRCTATRPDVASQTKEASITPVTETLNITVMPRISDHVTKARAGADAQAYANWFEAVHEPA